MFLGESDIPKHVRWTACQSCGMPRGNEEERGTEVDGSFSALYCASCYRDGQYTEPDATAGDMIYRATLLMHQQGMDTDQASSLALALVCRLDRWQKRGYAEWLRTHLSLLIMVAGVALMSGSRFGFMFSWTAGLALLGSGVLMVVFAFVKRATVVREVREAMEMVHRVRKETGEGGAIRESSSGSLSGSLSSVTREEIDEDPDNDPDND
jgi:Putative zinc ribbon domain